MSDAFEEAKHHGYSAADMAADMQEIKDRMEMLGCPICKYRNLTSHTCDAVIKDELGIYKCGCPFWKKEE